MCTASVGDLRGVRIVGDHDHGRAVGPRELRDQPAHRVGRRGVELAGRLVGEQQLRTVRERRAQRDALSLASGELRGERIEPVAETGRLKQRDRARPLLVARCAAERERQRHSLSDPEIRGQHRFGVLPEKADLGMAQPRAHAIGQPADVLPGHVDDAGRGCLEPGDHAQHRALARPARPEHAHDLALLHGERRPLERRCVAVVGAVHAEHIA